MASEITFIDIHTMVGSWHHGDLPFLEPDALANEMNRLRIKKAFTYHSTARQHSPAIGNPMLVDILQTHESLIGIMVLTPLIEIEFGGKKAVCAFLQANRFGAVMLCPTDHNFTLEPWNLEEVFTITEENNLPVFFDMNQNDGMLTGQYDKFYQLANACLNTPVVLLSVGYRHLRVLFKLMDKCSNIHISTDNFGAFRGIEEMVNYLSAERILFGSHSPFVEAGVAIGRVLYADIPEADKKLIAYGNAERLLRGNKFFTKGTMV